MHSEHYLQGHHHGYAAIFEDGIEPKPPHHPLHASEYIEGFKAGLQDGRLDYWEMKQEQDWMDRQNGL